MRTTKTDFILVNSHHQRKVYINPYEQGSLSKSFDPPRYYFKITPRVLARIHSQLCGDEDCMCSGAMKLWTREDDETHNLNRYGQRIYIQSAEARPDGTFYVEYTFSRP